MRGLIIVNSFHRDRMPAPFLERLSSEYDLQVRHTDFPHHAKYLAREAADCGLEVVIAAGGDGTVNEVINGLAGSDTAFSILPFGTANDLAHQLGIRMNTHSGSRWLDYAHTKSIDLIRVNNWCYSTVGGLGLPCDVLLQREHLRQTDSATGTICRISQRYAYLWALTSLFGRITSPRGPLRIETQGETYMCDPVSLLIANQPTVGHSFRVAPAAVNTDGLCDLFVINRDPHRIKSLAAVARCVYPLWHEPDNVLRLQTKHLRLTCEHPTAFFGDGESFLHSRTFDIQVLPRALRVLVPCASSPVTSLVRRYRAIHRVVPATAAAAESSYWHAGS